MKISRAGKAGKHLALSIIEMVDLMYQKNTARNFMKGLQQALHQDEKDHEPTKDVELKKFKPTVEQINALPEGIRAFVHDLETRCDPAGDVAALTLIRDQNTQLKSAHDKLKAKLADIRELARYLAYFRDVTGRRFMDYLPHEWQEKIAQALS